jgi:hypothetical protein
MSSEFKAPKGWDSYVSSVIDKTRLLISLGIWEGIDELDLNRWLKNFKGQEGKYFSACILDAFTYRSKKMCHSMMRNILMDMVPNFCRNNAISNFETISEWKNRLSEGDSLVRFVPVNIMDGRVKSATVVARNFIEANDLQQRFVQQPDAIGRAIENGTKVIVFLDDFAGSGSQFLRFIKENPLDAYLENVKFLYAPLCAHIDAIEKIRRNAPFVRVIPIDRLKREHNFFSACSRGYFRGDGINSVESAKEYYLSLFENSSERKYLFGMSSQSLTYSFFMSTPNNNLKALYHNESGVWNRLVFRGRS